MKMRRFITLVSLVLAIAALTLGFNPASAQDRPVGWGKGHDRPIGWGKGNIYGKMRTTKPAQRKAAAKNAQSLGLVLGSSLATTLAPGPGGVPDYFGPYPNYATSPLPVGPVGKVVVESGGFGYSATPSVDISDAYGAGTGAVASATVAAGVITEISVTSPGSGYIAPVVTITDSTGEGAIATGTVTPDAGTGLRKFLDTLPIPTFAVPTPCNYSGQDADCYEIWEVEYRVQMHSDLPPVSGTWPNQTGGTLLRGYVQVDSGGNFVAPPSYLGPIIAVQRDKPVRVTFRNKLPIGAGGDLFIPVDSSYMGAGFVPSGNSYSTTEKYTQNRTAVHLHGATTPWISDGTVFQWFTPAGETTSYPTGVSVANVPDMTDPGPGAMTFFYTNQQSARLMFYHDHAAGITRLNVYAGLAAGYLVRDSDTARDPITPIYGDGIPLIIQDKTFVPGAAQLAAQDPTWNWGTLPTTELNGTGNLWFPHVYMTNQNPWDPSGANAMGRWDYGPWFWPPFTNLIYGPIPNPYCLPTPPASPTATTWDCSSSPWEPPFIPGVPSVSGTPESFMDTPVVNGMAYPTLNVPAGPVRFRILSIGNDRMLSLSLWVADPSTVYPTGYSGPGNTEVKMVPFNSAQNAITPFPTSWYDFDGYQSGSVPNPFDDRIGGVPDPSMRGPAMIQIATEGGFLPAPVIIKNQPVNYVMNKRDITIGNVKEKALFLGPAERADVIVDFTNFAGKTLILYNDAPAPVPAGDPRLDYFTGDRDLTSTGGAPSTVPGYGPNTRTVMQIVVAPTADSPYPCVNPGCVDDYNPATFSALQATLPTAFAASQDTIIVPQHAYDAIYGTNTVDTTGVNLVRIQDTSMTFTPIGQNSPVTFDFYPKSIIEDFQMDYGRMNATLGVEIPHTNNTNQTSIIQNLVDPPTEVIKISDPSLTPIGTMADGTQIWKITHNGVDTHPVHVHMFTAQIVNRVGWDGAIRLPDPNEMGFKDTIRMNPLEDTIIALRPIKLNLPFKVQNSFRPLAPEAPIGATLGPTGMPLFQNTDPNGLPVTITNDIVNFGWEYVWHCHILGHEENDFMRPMALAAPPDAPSALSAIPLSGPSRVNLSWTDNSANATGFTLQRATDAAFTSGVATFAIGTVTPNPQTYTDNTVVFGTPYYYRVLASNTVGSTVPGYPQVTADSNFSNTASTVGFSISGKVTSGATGLAGVTIALGGGATASKLTDAAGNYSFAGLADGSYTVTPSLAGYTFAPVSANPTIAGSNVTGVNFAATGMPIYSISGTVRAGATGLAGVTMTLSGAATGTTTTAANGTYSFSALANGSYTVTPSLAGYTFAPVSANPTIASANVPGINFTGTVIPTITVTSPNGGENLAQGSIQIIRWTFTGNPGINVKIELLKGGVLASTISPLTYIGFGGSGSFSWFVPFGQASGTDYSIRITSTSNASITDTSNANFSIGSSIAPTITVTTPNGGESWMAGTTQTITWTYAGNPGSAVKIDLYKGGAYNSAIIASTGIGTGGNGSYNWPIPSNLTPGTDYTVVITSTTNAAYTDVSNANFTITAPLPSSITVTTPNGGESWMAGTTQTITWTYAGNPGNAVKIDLYKGGAYNSTIIASTGIGTGGNGSYNWPIPSNLTPGTDYTVVITSTTIAVSDVSNANFTITAPPPSPITVTSPNGGETWARSTLQTIRWTFTGNPGTFVKIELLKGGALVSTISSSAYIGSGGTGSYFWFVPFGQTPGTDYSIRITSTSNASITDTSNANFSIQ